MAIIGSTGAIGKVFVRCCAKDTRISELAILTRHKLDEWNTMEFIPKVKFIERPDFDDISDLKGDLAGYDVFISCLGTRVKVGEEMFVKVDY